MAEHRQVSPARKVAFYLGYLSMAAGGILLISPWADGFPLTPGRLGSMALRVLGGLALIALGLFLRRIGIRGMAGSLVTLDPPRAKEDLEPWSRAAGGLLDAALSEVEAVREVAARAGTGEAIKVRCPRCKALNDEKAKFCDQCAGEL